MNKKEILESGGTLYYPPFPKQHQKRPGLTSKMKPIPDHGENSYKGSNKLSGKRVLITGGDSGIGRACTISFSREGASVAINYLPSEETDARSIKNFLKQEGINIHLIPGDIRSESFCKKLADEVNLLLGGIDVVVNCAGEQHAVASIMDITTEQFDSTFKTNVYALFWITKFCLPYMKEGSVILTTSSGAAYVPEFFLLDYSQTKAAIIAFTKSLSKQLAQYKIRVNGVAPGPFWTPLQPSGGMFKSTIPTFGASTPLGRPGQPFEISPIYVLLASDECSYTTGQIWGCDGGIGFA